MKFEDLQKIDVRLGDMLFVTRHYETLGDSTYGGPIVAVYPIVVYPYSGNNNYYIPSILDSRDTFNYIRLPFVLRMLNIIRSFKAIARGTK